MSNEQEQDQQNQHKPSQEDVEQEEAIVRRFANWVPRANAEDLTRLRERSSTLNTSPSKPPTLEQSGQG